MASVMGKGEGGGEGEGEGALALVFRLWKGQSLRRDVLISLETIKVDLQYRSR